MWFCFFLCNQTSTCNATSLFCRHANFFLVIFFSYFLMHNHWAFCESAFRKFFSQIVTGYLPSLILQLFLKLVPPAMEFLSSIQGYISHSDIEMSASRKVLWFTVWNVFFATVFSGSILSMFNTLLDPKNIPGKLAVAVPAQVRKCFSPL